MNTAAIFLAGPMPDLDRPERRVPPVGAVGAHADLEVPTGQRSSTTARHADPVQGSGPSGVTTLRQRLRARIAARDVDFSIAADGGLDLAFALGHVPGFVVGDMDSVSPGAIETARDLGSSITVVPRAKDASDFELALDSAIERGASRLVVVGGAGGRLDHVLATVLTLTAQKYSRLVIEALLVDNYVAVIHGGGAASNDVAHLDTASGHRLLPTPSVAVMDGLPGEPVSLFAVNGPADDVHTRGLAWRLDGDRLDGGTSRGVSNELVSDTASVAVGRGCLAVVRTAVYEEVDDPAVSGSPAATGPGASIEMEKVGL